MSVDVLQLVERDGIGDGLKVFFGVVVVACLRGAWRLVKSALHAQKRIAETNEQIANALDPSTPGGLGDIQLPLRDPGEPRSGG